jgi:2-dehydro-3-deoxygluconokinase
LEADDRRRGIKRSALRTHHDVVEPLPPSVIRDLLDADERTWASAKLTDEGVVPG